MVSTKVAQGGNSDSSRCWFPVQRILFDSGAIQASYVSSAWLDEQRVLDQNLEVHEVNSHVLLGDNRTRVKITEAVNLRLKFIRDNGKEVIADVLCYVIPHSPNTTPIILGVPAILSASLFDYFLEILREGFRLIGHSERSSKARAENYMSSLQNIKEELIPWPSVRDPLSPEELETDMPDSFSDCLSFLTTTQEEAEEKYEADVLKFTDERWKQHQGNVKILDYLNSPLVKQTFLPKSWEGFKNVQGAGANDKDEFELNWDEEGLPKQLDAKVRPISPRLEAVVSKELKRLNGYLWEDSTSPICCPLTVAPKDTPPFVRIASDSRPINPFIKAPKEYIPNVQQEIRKMSGFSVFADIDQTNSFHQIKLALLSRQRLAVKTPLGLKQPLFVPEGISPGSAMLQRINRWIFREMEDCMVVMFDNLLIGGTDYDDLQRKLDKFFEICRRHNVICKMAKSRFGQDYANFFGYVVRKDSWELTQERKDTVNAITFPHTLKGMQSYLGMALFFKPFIENYSELTSDLNEMTMKNFNWTDKSTWNKDYENTFNIVKQNLQNSQKLYFPDYNNEFILRTDASKNAVGGILLQRDKDGNLLPIAMVSCKLSETAQRWDAYKLECFAIYYCVKKLSHYLHGKEFVIETDHQNLQWLEKNDSAIVMRWRWYLQNYQTLIRHIPGKKNVVADYFSRMYSMSEEPTDDVVNQDDDQEDEFDVCQFYGLDGSEYKEAPTIKLDLKHARLTATVNIKTTSDMSLAFSNFIQQYVILYTIPYNGFNFTFKKQKILGSQTPNDLGLKDGDEIIVTGEPYVPDGYVANSTITSIMESDDIKELGSIHFLGRPTKKSSRVNSNRTIRFLNTDTNEVEAHLVQMNAAKSRSTVSRTYLAQQTHLNYKIVDGKVTLPVFLTLKHTDSRRMALETELDFVVLDDQSGFVIGYPHLTYTFKTLLNMLYHGVVEDTIHDDYERYDVIASDDADTEAEAIEKAKPMLIQPGLNPLHLVTLPKRLSDLPDQLRQHVMACKRTAELVNIDDPSIVQRVVIKLDSGMENIRSAVSIALVHQYPELFKPTYYEKPISGSTSLSGHPVSCLGETTLLIRLQHDTTGLWTESQIRLRIVDAQERSYLILSYFDSIRHFYDIYMRIHETFRTCLQLELDPSNYINPTKDGKQLFPDGILSPPSRQIIFRRDGQIVKDPAIHAAVKQSLPTVHNLVEASDDGDDSEDSVMFYNIPTDFFNFPVHYLNHITLDDDEGEREGDQGILGINNDTADTNDEVECKFYLTDDIAKTLQSYTGTSKVIIDLYYDDPLTYHISGKDNWLRKRDKGFELKRPNAKGHQGGISRYMEITSNVLILEALSIAHHNTEIDDTQMEEILQENNIIPYAKIITHRTTYGITMDVSQEFKRHLRDKSKSQQQHSFQIDVDRAQLECLISNQTSQYDIAEVELRKPYVMNPFKSITDVVTQLKIDPEVLKETLNGKLVECIRRHNDACYDILVANGIVKDSTKKDEDLANIINELNEWMKEIHGGFNLHLGAKRTYAKAKERFPGHKLPFKFFEEYVASCGTCQKQRASMGLAFRALVKTLKLPLKPRACVGVDTLSLPEDKYGYKYVHIIVQLFSKLVFAYPSKNNTADSVCDALLTYFATHGLFNVMSIDPGSNLLAETVDLLNRQLNITQKVSMVDVHTSNGVENSGCKPIIRHLQALTSDFRIKDRWSEPKYFQWCLFMINSSMNSEIDNIPFALHYGDYDKLAEKYPDAYPSNKETRSAYIKDLWELQRIATEASRKYQQSLHDKRVAVTPVHLANQYQPGDYVLRLREIPINNNKLQRLKYRGPYKVLKQEGNRVYVTHCSNNKEDVFPVEKLVIFDNSRDEAFKVAQLDDDEFLVLAIVGYKGNPLSRQSGCLIFLWIK